MQITPLSTELVRSWRNGSTDSNGQAPEPATSNGSGNRCRHCLNLIPEGAPYLIVAHRPFEMLHPYAETGPLFVCANDCDQFNENGGELPDGMQSTPDFLIKGYSSDERIVYGTGTIVTPRAMADRVAEIFADPKIAFIHVRSARNNCYQCRIDRD